MKTKTENRFFKLTRAGIEDYKKSDPLESARDPRQSYFKGQWDVNWAFTKWITTIIFLFWSFVIDMMLLPFQVMGQILKSNGKTKTK